MLNPAGARERRRPLTAARDGGYVVAMTALLMLPLMAFTGLAVDLGAWYARAAQIQRTTDAASLAGVAFIPIDEGDAIAAAHRVAQENGFQNGVDGITVLVEPLAGDRMRVTITDAQVPQYFTQFFRPNVSVARSSVAEYVPPIRMGSPRNFLGTGDMSRSVSGLYSPIIKEEFWLAVNGPCDRLEDGDLRESRRMGTNSSSNKCTGGTENYDRIDTNGYAYGVSTTESYIGGELAIEVFDAPYCPTGSYDFNLGSSRFTTTYTVREMGTDPFNGSTIGTADVLTESNCGGWGGQWVELARVNPTAGETYVVQVQSSNHTSSSNTAGANVFSLRARRTSGAFTPCSADLEDREATLKPANAAAAANCPNVFAFRDLSIFVHSEAAQAEFFLASIGPEHSGKTLVIELFDPGEGGETLRITDPNGNFIGPGNLIGDGNGGQVTGITSFERSIRQRWGSEVAPSGGWGPVTESEVDISQTGTQPGTGRSSGWRFNERALRLEIELPDNIDAAYGGRTWWRVWYDFQDDDVTDRTTWSVSVEGGPVRLIE